MVLGDSAAMHGAKGGRPNREGRVIVRPAIPTIRGPTGRHILLPAFLPFVFAILWASSYVAAKAGLADISPYAFVAIRLVIAAAAALLLAHALRRPFGPARQRWLHLLIGGALVHGLALATAHKALI